jgi:hypothetical protein
MSETTLEQRLVEMGYSPKVAAALASVMLRAAEMGAPYDQLLRAAQEGLRRSKLREGGR